MAYSVIQPPFTLKFREMPRKELKEHYDWFLGVIPQRLSELAVLVRSSPRFGAWELDYTPASLESLGEWLVGQVAERQRTPEEMLKIRNRLTFPIEIPDKDLTNRTFYLAMDVGMYLSQVFLRNHPSVSWKHDLQNKKFVDYGQPVLVGFAVPLNPVRVALVLAYKLVSKTETGRGLREIYDIWAKQIQD
jgi:hypothetical protein